MSDGSCGNKVAGVGSLANVSGAAEADLEKTQGCQEAGRGSFSL